MVAVGLHRPYGWQRADDVAVWVRDIPDTDCCTDSLELCHRSYCVENAIEALNVHLSKTVM
jgi:hypothetical protein